MSTNDLIYIWHLIQMYISLQTQISDNVQIPYVYANGTNALKDSKESSCPVMLVNYL